MPSVMSSLAPWLLFFCATIYGHVAMKLAVNATSENAQNSFLASLSNPWGSTALLSWGCSGLLWLWILSKHTLIEANSISSLKYLGICLASFLFLHEAISKNQLLGIALVAAGVYLVTKS